MKNKSVHLLDEHFISKDEMKELTLIVEKLEQGVEHLKRNDRELTEKLSIINDEMVSSLTFRMFIVISLYVFVQIMFRFW